MKKSIKMIAIVMMAVVMMIASQEYTLAATTKYSWAIRKMPGSTTASDKIYVPPHTEDMEYEVDTLYGTPSLVVARCENPPSVQDRYYINNSTKNIRVSKVSTTTFRMYFDPETTFAPGEKMEFYSIIEHNAGDNLINETIVSLGSINRIE